MKHKYYIVTKLGRYWNAFKERIRFGRMHRKQFGLKYLHFLFTDYDYDYYYKKEDDKRWNTKRRSMPKQKKG